YASHRGLYPFDCATPTRGGSAPLKISAAVTVVPAEAAGNNNQRRKRYDITTIGRDERKHSRRSGGPRRGGRCRINRHGRLLGGRPEPGCGYTDFGSGDSFDRLRRSDRVLRALPR